MISSLGKETRMPSTSWGQVDQELLLIYMNNMDVIECVKYM